MATEVGPSFRWGHGGALPASTHPLAHHPDPPPLAAVTLGDLSGFAEAGAPSPFQGNQLSLAAAGELSHHPPRAINRGELVRPPWDLKRGLRVGVLVISGAEAGLHRCGTVPA